MFIFTTALWTSRVIPIIMDYFPPLNMKTSYNETENMLYNNAIISVVSITNEPNIKQCTLCRSLQSLYD
jgi:hypothetical protein